MNPVPSSAVTKLTIGSLGVVIGNSIKSSRFRWGISGAMIGFWESILPISGAGANERNINARKIACKRTTPEKASSINILDRDWTGAATGVSSTTTLASALATATINDKMTDDSYVYHTTPQIGSALLTGTQRFCG